MTVQPPPFPTDDHLPAWRRAWLVLPRDTRSGWQRSGGSTKRLLQRCSRYCHNYLRKRRVPKPSTLSPTPASITAIGL